MKKVLVQHRPNIVLIQKFKLDEDRLLLLERWVAFMGMEC